MLTAGAVDEANADVFDQLIESWRSQEAAEIEAIVMSDVATWACEREQISVRIDLIDEQSSEADMALEDLRSELRVAREHLRGAS
jgi:hypothetical protein